VTKMAICFLAGLVVGWALCKRVGKQVYCGRHSFDGLSWGYNKYVNLVIDKTYHYLYFGRYYLEVRLPHQRRNQ